MDVKESKYARNRQRWFVLAVLCLFVPFAWIVSIAIFVELFRHRQDGEIARQAELAAGISGVRTVRSDRVWSAGGATSL
jgi:hypothetical protein